MNLHVVIPHRPVGPNAAYRRKKGAGIYMTKEGHAYKNAVRVYAFFKAREVGWPKPETVKSCDLIITTFNTKHDADAAAKLAIDAMEGIIFSNDRVVRSVTCRKEKDYGKVRVEIEASIP